MNLTNEQLMWMSLGIWALFVLVLGYLLVFGKKSTVLAAPSGSDIIIPGGS